MTKLSVNINKIAVIRNSRGGRVPSVAQAAAACERFGAAGITVHPRPDERHIRYSDVRELAGIVTGEFNIEGNPTGPFADLVMEVKPAQVTLVPDAPGAITSNAGWDTVAHAQFLREVTARFKAAGVRVSIFVDPLPEMVIGAYEAGADRVELYTEGYAHGYATATDEAGREAAIAPYLAAAREARRLRMGLNAGHDLDLENLRFFADSIPWTDEVSIGHALVSDALYFGLEKTIAMYLERLS